MRFPKGVWIRIFQEVSELTDFVVMEGKSSYGDRISSVRRIWKMMRFGLV